MNILFMSLSNYQTIYFHGLYSDLLRQFIKNGDKVFVISPFERATNESERVIHEEGATVVKIKIWNMQKTNIIEKGISMLTIDRIFIRAIKKYFSDVKFDLVLYPTPPITLLKAVEYVKKRDGVKTYLLLKDIFPQNAVDIGMMSTTGVKGLLYKHFRKQEKRLYAISDRIGCMSHANVDYLIKHNPEVNRNKVEVCPNSTDPIDMSCSEKDKIAIRAKYGIPLDKTVFVYGGNLGKPQGIPFIIECLKECRSIKSAFFLIFGSGTEYQKIEDYIKHDKPDSVILMNRMPKEDYEKMIGSCDVGLVFLDYRFTIPNYPSRILAYMQAQIPILACTDESTDIGKMLISNQCGWWCKSSDAQDFQKCVKNICETSNQLEKFGKAGFDVLNKCYSSEVAYKIIRKEL